MRLFNKVAIIGVGLIGGSIGLAIKKKKLAREIIGFSRHKEILSLARKIKAIDRGVHDLSVIKEVDLVILATPVAYPAGGSYEEAAQEKLSQRTRKDLKELVYDGSWGKPFQQNP